METTLIKLHDSTMRLVSQIDAADQDQLLAIIELRDVVISTLQQKPLVSDEEKELLSQINAADPIILSRMSALMNEAAQGLEKIARTRVQKKNYEKAYAAESYFIDTRSVE